MKIALISHLFPTKLHPFHGKFIQDQLFLLNEESNISTELIVPTPYSFPFTKRYTKNNSPLLSGNVAARRIEYLSFPQKNLPSIISKGLHRTFRKELEGELIDIAHVHWLYPDGLCIPVLKEMGFKCVLTIHGSDWYRTKIRTNLFNVLKKSLHKADIILCSGPKLKEDMDLELPKLAAKTKVIYNTVDSSKYKPVSVEEKKELEEKLQWKPNKLHALTVANLRHEKGVDILLDAVTNNESLRNIHFHIVGASRNDDYGKEILQKIHSAKFGNIYYHPPVHPDKLIEYYQASDFFVLPSRREGFNVSILEAMSCGLPVVCTNAGGNDIVVNNETGIMTKETNSSEIQHAILRLASQIDEYNSSEIHAQIEVKFGRKAFLKSLKGHYNSIF